MAGVLKLRALLLQHVSAVVFDFCILEYIYNLHIDSNMHNTYNLSQMAAAHGDINTLKYLWSIGAFFEPCTAAFAATHNQVKVLKYLTSLGFDLLKYDLFEYEIFNISVNVAKYLVSIGYDVRTISPFGWYKNNTFIEEIIDLARINKIPAKTKLQWIKDPHLPRVVKWAIVEAGRAAVSSYTTDV